MNCFLHKLRSMLRYKNSWWGILLDCSGVFRNKMFHYVNVRQIWLVMDHLDQLHLFRFIFQIRKRDWQLYDCGNFLVWSNREDRRDYEEKDERGDEELKPLTREELKQRAIDHVRNLEKRALQEQSKYSDITSGTVREKSTAAVSRAAETGKTSTTRGR